MAQRRSKYRHISRDYRKLPITPRHHIPHEDTIVLQHEPLPPLEHGGVYEEMGADFTYEEMNAHVNPYQSMTDYNAPEIKVHGVNLYGGVLSLLIAIASLFVWPFWTGLSALVVAVVSYSQGTKALSWLAGTVAVIAMASSILNYLVSL